MADKTTQDLTEWVENYTKIIDHYLKKIHKPVNLENQVISRFFNEEGEWHDQHTTNEIAPI